MGKRKKSTGGRNAFDNPLAAARSGKATTTPATKAPADRPASETVTANESALIDFDFGKEKRKDSSSFLSAKMNQKAEQIWHRRSGAGFHLFVEYYAGQPEGIAARFDSAATVAGTAASAAERNGLTQNAATSAPAKSGAGLSRAALRRKKKKRKTTTTTTMATASPEETVPPTEKAAGDSQTALHSPSETIPRHLYDSLLYKGRLLDVLASAAKTTTMGAALIASPDFYQFLAALSKPLPLTFRFRHYPPTEQYRRLQTIAGLKQILKGATLASSGVQPVAFDPDHIYQAVPRSRREWALDKASLKRACPELKEFLNDHTRDGTIARQELGSMLPVWLLDAIGAFEGGRRRRRRPTMRVLDVCASPGSKTLQASEMVAPGGGRVRANDVNANRLESLREAVQRSGVFGSDDPNNNNNNNDDDDDDDDDSEERRDRARMDSAIKYSNVDASKYPIPRSESKKYPIILCDVPCSGDGTCRKDVHVIPNWTPSISNALHSLQVKILVRAMRCVSKNGIVSYSTCSLNPIEDEAVVLAALDQQKQEDAGLEFELVPITDSLRNGLVLRPGVSHWRVADFQYSRDTRGDEQVNRDDDNDDDDDDDDDDKHGPIFHSDDDNDNDDRPARLRWHDSYRQAVADGMEGALPTMWPPSKEVASSVPLDRCLRLCPQDQDTGGFFVALLRRIK